MSETAKDLERSAKFFAAESLKNASEATDDSARWSLAVLLLITSLEHAAKAMLARKHVAFIRESLERPERTVGIEIAFARLRDPEILGIRLSEKDVHRVKAAVKARNDIAHGGIQRNVHALEARFFEILSLLRELFRFQFEISLGELIDQGAINNLLSAEKAISEMRKRAIEQLDPREPNFNCPECSDFFMVERDAAFVCLFCLWEEPSTNCDRCSIIVPEWTLNKVSELFDYDFVDGIAELVDDFGIIEKNVCDDCFARISIEIGQEKSEREMLYPEEYWYGGRY